MPRSPSRRLLMTTAVLLLALLVGFGTVLPYPLGSLAPSEPRSIAPSGGSVQLAWARASILQAGGPAHAPRPATALDPAPMNVGVWANLSTKVVGGPSGRLPAMTWDAADGYVLLFGGYGCSVTCFLADTWTFSNGVWTNVTRNTTGAPPALAYAGMAYDPSSAKVVLYGGIDRLGRLGYTWEYSAGSWTNVSASAGPSPSPRDFPSMATDTADGLLVLTGGQLPTGHYGTDTWTFHRGYWTNVTSTAGAIDALTGAPVASDDPADHGTLLCGITTANEGTSATWIYSGGIWHNVTATAGARPPDLIGAEAGYLADAPGVLVFGDEGFNRTLGLVEANETWIFAHDTWDNLTGLVGTGPTEVFAGAAVDPSTDALFLYGGAAVRGPSTSTYFYALASAPVVSASASRAVVDAGMPFDVTAHVTGGVAPSTISWDFGDGSPNVSGAIASHVFATPGFHEPTVTATSFVGATGRATVPIYVNPALSISANSSSATPGTATTFSLLVAGGTAPFSYAWNFGDAATSSAAEPTHAYHTTGSYTVSVTVTDSLGANVSKLLTVVVRAPSISLTSGTGLGLVVAVLFLVAVVVILAILLLRKPKNPAAMPPYGANLPPVGAPPASPPPP